MGKIYRNSLLILSGALFLFSCNKVWVNNANEDNLTIRFEGWRADTMGCKGLRETMIGDVLALRENGFLQSRVPVKEIIKIFGIPEYTFVMVKPGHLYFSYFYKSKCILPDNQCNAEYQYMMDPTIDFIFENGELTSISNDLR